MNAAAGAVKCTADNTVVLAKRHLMKLECAIRVLAGSMVLISLALAHWVSPYWLWLTAFVGLNLIQSAFTGFCPAEIILKKLGLGKQNNCCRSC